MSIGLAMIVRNEAQIIERCLQSVRDLIDTWVIVDTGSEDETPEIIQHTLRDIPGELHRSKWVDFETNRTELMRLARGKATYLLLIDADMTVEHNGKIDADENVDSYMIRHADDPEYWIKRLVRGGRRWYYVGATHEYITTDGPDNTAKLDGVEIHHHGDGAYRSEKFERDLELLTNARERNPEDTRTAFYLANTLRDLGRPDEAVPVYRERADMGGWDEEVFYALLEAGRLSNDIGTLFEAWSKRPQRAEPLYELALRFRGRKQWHPAHLCAQRGATIPVPPDRLFLHRYVYDWGCLFELSIAAWWIGNYDEAREASDRLLAENKLPVMYRRRVIENREFLPVRE